MSNQTSSSDRAKVRLRRARRAAPAYVFWASVCYAILYTGGVWYGSGGGQDPGFAFPFGWLWGLSLVVVLVGVARYLVR